jgi:hypothetical protein
LVHDVQCTYIINKYIHAVHPTEPKSLLMLKEAEEGFGLSILVQTRTKMFADFQIKSMHTAYTVHMLHSARYVFFFVKILFMITSLEHFLITAWRKHLRDGGKRGEGRGLTGLVWALGPRISNFTLYTHTSAYQFSAVAEPQRLNAIENCTCSASCPA